MKIQKLNLLTGIIFLFFGAVIIINSCNSEDINPGPIPEDTQLMQEIVNIADFQYTIFHPTIVQSVSNSPREFERVRINSIGNAVLGNDGRLPKGGVFPDGTIIVKEAYSGLNGTLIQYAIMKKESTNKYARNGWLWYEVNADGSKPYSIGMKGQKCINCHTKPANRDATRTFEER
ncbi:MAG: cytochrome P460 family protein [Cyclobacteriaceae bacterium]|nr:cytochrome P460 family protein [Cyclobacteriaceae bacterium]